MVVQVVQQVGLLVGLGTFARNVVEEHGKATYPQLIHLLELVQQILAVFVVPLDVLPRMDGPIEDDIVLAGLVYQLLQLGRLAFGIGLAPVRSAVIGVVLGTVQIDIHLVATVKVQLAQAGFMTPGGAVETLNHATVGHVRVVGNLGQRQLGKCQQLCQRLHTVVGTARIGTGDDDLILVHLQVIAFGLGWYPAGILAYCLVALDAYRYPKGRLGLTVGQQRAQQTDGTGSRSVGIS